ncbi:MAG TPA: hypothetical protein VK196_18635 [Magnetospirillum sp.]|nr:hypothetical protein [Magnetospirillum sp.]
MPTPAVTAHASTSMLVFFDLPTGCYAHPMPNDMHAPHLRAGEWAVIDPACREIEPGELYLVRQSSGPIVWQVLPSRRPTPERPCWMLAPMNRPSSYDDAMRALKAGQRVYCSDGPIYGDCLDVLGKVVGVFVPLVDPMPAAVLPMIGRPALLEARP